MKIAKTIESVRKLVNTARNRGKKIGFVPTMGALHIGHISLIKAAKKNCRFVVVSIFVNPTQFGPGEDFEKYPRPVDKDINICKEQDVDVVFLPAKNEMYPAKHLTWVNVEELTEPLCGRLRPVHFRGVTTVCTKLFNIVQPDLAFFDQKEAQQAIVIKRMVADMNMPLQIVVCPTVREPSGLAVSSRNKYLTSEQRKNAALIYKSLQKSKELIDSGVTEVNKITDEMQRILKQVSSIQIQYTTILDAETLRRIDSINGRVLVAISAKIGPAKLIDNIIVDVKK